MPQARTIIEQPRRKSTMRRGVGGLFNKSTNPAENLVEFVKVLETIEVTPEKLALNSKYMIGPDGSKIEY